MINMFVTLKNVNEIGGSWSVESLNPQQIEGLLLIKTQVDSLDSDEQAKATKKANKKMRHK